MAEKNKGKPVGASQNVGVLAVLYTLGILAVALGVIFVSPFLPPSVGVHVPDAPGSIQAMQPGGDGFPPSNRLFEDSFIIRLVLSALNVVLVIYLLFVYIKDYLRLKSRFTLGIIAFLASFLLYALSTMPILHLFIGRFGIAGVFSFIPMLFTAIGLIILAKLSNE